MNTLIHILFFFFFNDTATTEIYTLSLHDALPIFPASEFAGANTPPNSPSHRKKDCRRSVAEIRLVSNRASVPPSQKTDRKSTRLNSSHLVISYAVFCLKKKKKSLPHANFVH